MPSHHSLVVLFDAIVLVATVLVLCTFLPAILSRNVKRSIGWYSLMTAWLVYSLSYGLLIGRQEGPEPPFGLCLFQTLLVYAVPPLVSTGMTCYYIEFYLIVSGLRSGNPRPYSSWRTFWLVVLPWLVFFAIILEVVLLVFPGKRVNLVERAGNNFYCHLGNGIPNLVSASTVIANMVILLPLEVWTGYMMYRNWDVFRRLSRTDRQIFLTVYLRLMFCTLAAIVAFAFSMLAFVFPQPDTTSIVYPTLPIFIAFAFGTQKDLLRAWQFWRPQRPYGSIIFNSGSSNIDITTNIYTSWGAVTSESTTTSGTASQIQKPIATDGRLLGTTGTVILSGVSDPEALSTTTPGVAEKPSTADVLTASRPLVYFAEPPSNIRGPQPQQLEENIKSEHDRQSESRLPFSSPSSV
ncbi:hypothetical protein D9756_003442 [Leucocoprinus leucothites]|uniref:Uncharacterized protein n=1 Tax=Leucocoprinus leucothites TaxID=201217 RepID=A0A8H5G7C3_9AGAR|nr:hypothetical protein D9756_003442 [Leucoagaricus leucothites]